MRKTRNGGECRRGFRIVRRVILSLLILLAALPPLPARASALTLTLSHSNLTLNPGESIQLTAESSINYDFLSWSVEDETVAQISSDAGNAVTVTAIHPGLTRVHAWIGSGFSEICTVAVSGIILTPDSLSLYADGSAHIRLERYGAAESVGVWNWSSDHSRVASVARADSGAIVTAVSPGSAHVTCSGGGFSASCPVTVSHRYGTPVTGGYLRAAGNAAVNLTYWFRDTAVTAASTLCALYDAAGQLLNTISLSDSDPESDASGAYQSPLTVSIPCDPGNISSAKLFSLDDNGVPLSPASVLAPPSDGVAPNFMPNYPTQPVISFDKNSTEFDRCMIRTGVAADRACRLFWALYPASSARTPTAALFQSGNLPESARNGQYSLARGEIYTVEITGLREMTEYSLWLWLSAPDFSAGSTMRRIPLTTGDATLPVFLSYPNLTEARSNALEFSLTLSEDASFYWAAVLSGSRFPAVSAETGFPSAETAIRRIINGTDAVAHGMIRARAMISEQFAISGLRPENDYDIWFIAEDASGNFSDYPAGNPNNPDDPTSPRKTCCVTASTLDTAAPAVTQEFTRYPMNEPTTPYCDTSIQLIFSEPVRLTSTGALLADLYAAVTDAASESERASARDLLADALRENVILHVHDISNSARSSAAPERNSSNQASTDTGVESWAIDYRFATVTSDGKKMILTFPTTSEQGDAKTSALSLDAGVTYHFEISGFSDLSENANRMLTTRLNNFTTVPPKAELKRLALRASSYPADVDIIDLAFSVSPVSTSHANLDYWDLFLWSDVSAEYEVYTRSRPADSGVYDFPWRLIQNGDGEGGHTEITVPSGVEFYGRSLHYHVQRLRESELPALSQFKDDRVYEYAIRFLKLNGGDNRASWSQEVNFRVSVVRGEFSNIWNLAADLTPDKFNLAKRAGTIADISDPDNLKFILTRNFVDTEPPEFSAGRPLFTPSDTSVSVKLLLNRAGTVYYCAAPADSSLALLDENNRLLTMERKDEIPTSGGAADLIPFKLSSPSFRDVVSGRYQDESEGIISGSVSTSSGMVTAVIDHLLPNRDYFICFVLRGVSAVYTPYAQAFRFATTEAVPPVLSGSVSNPTATLSSSRAASLHYALIDPSGVQMFSQSFWNNAPSGDQSPAYDAYGNITSVLQAMSVNTIDSDASVFDIYATQTFKDQIAAYIQSAATGRYVLGVGHEINLRADEKYPIDCSAFPMARGAQYALTALATSASGRSFRVLTPISLPDENPLMITAITNGLKMDAENGAALDTCSGRVTLQFDKNLWYLDENAEPAIRRQVDLGPVSSSYRASFPDFIAIGELIANETAGKVTLPGRDNQVGQAASSVVIEFTAAKEGDFITFVTQLCDADGNVHDEPLTVSVKMDILGNGDLTPRPEITGSWNGRAAS